MQIFTLRGLTTTEYNAIKDAAKALPFPVTIRKHTQKYAAGMIDIRATKQTAYILTEDDIATLRTFCAQHNLDDRLGAIRRHNEWHPSCYRGGINYLGKTD